jgi:2-octaprenylphenol hydroxylase
VKAKTQTQDNTPVNADVVVVGAGMVGLSSAIALSKAGLKVHVIEQRDVDLLGVETWLNDARTQGYDPRVSALTLASQQWLTYVGAWSHIKQQRLSPYTDMDVWDGEGSGHIHFSSRELHEAQLGHIVENRVTLAGLFIEAREASDLTWHQGVTVKGLSAPSSKDKHTYREITLSDGTVLRAQLVIAADGAESQVRKLAAVPMWMWDYGHHAIVTTVTTEKAHQATAWQRFTDDGPLAFLPLDDPFTCSIVWSTSPDHAASLMALDDEAFCQSLGRAFEHRLGQVLATEARHKVPLKQRHAKQYVQAGLALIGDAAHTIHPLAGQGVNLGFMDAAALTEQLIQAHKAGQPLGDEALLRRYQRERQQANIQMSAAMEGFKQLFGHQAPLLKTLRGLGMNLLNRLDPVKQHIVVRAMGLKGDLPVLAQRKVPLDAMPNARSKNDLVSPKGQA